MYNILIVDDDFRDRNGICSTIKKFDLPLKTFTADCGNEGLNLLQNEKIDILITDIQMPDMLGTELAEKARKLSPDLSIILVSAHKDFQYAHSAISFGAIKYLLKPYFIDDLVETLNEAIKICDEKNIKTDRNPDTNIEKTILSFLSNENTVSDIVNIEEIVGQSEIQLVLVKILKTNTDHEKLYYKLQNLLTNSPIILPLPEQQCIVLNKNPACSTQQDFEEIIHIFRDEFDSEICITYSPFTLVSDLPNEYKNLCQTSEYFFFTNIGLAVFSKEIVTTISQGAPSVDAIMDKLQLLVEIENYTDFVPMISLLFSTLKNSSHFSALYAKCISSNIINMLYKKHKFSVSEQELLVKIFSANTAEEIILFFKEVVGKITENDNESDVNRLISQSLNIIENEYMNNTISLEYIAEKLYISPAHFSRLFKKQIGKNFIDFIKEYRLKKSRELLKNTNIRISEIAKMVGYDSTSYFTTIFHKYYNVTPAQYREKGDN